MESIYIGSQLFINKTDTPEMVRRWVGQMDENGLKIIRLFMIWEQLEIEKGKWNFSVYDACFEEASARGMFIVPTLMAVSPPGWMRLTKGVQSTADLDDPSFWNDIAMGYVAKVVEHYKNSPALHSWILWNEPQRWLGNGPYSIISYRKFLKKFYANDINMLNAVYYKKYACFEEITWDDGGSGAGSFPERIDMLYFTVDNLKEKLAGIAAEIKKIDSHPTHINLAGVGQNLLPGGQSIWRGAETVDFMGCSAHPPFHSKRFPADRVHQSIAYFADLMKSSTPAKNKLFWITEMQGGNAVFSSPVIESPSPRDIHIWLWESIASGARATLFWCFNMRNYGQEGGEWGLLNRRGKPSQRLLAAKKVSEHLQTHRGIFDAARPIAGQVSILYSDDSAWALDWMSGSGDDRRNPRNKHMGADAVAGAYIMCSDLGLTVNMVEEKTLLSDEWQESARVLILPSVTGVKKETIDAVGKFAQSGGMVIADGLFAMKDPRGNVAVWYDEKLSELFGVHIDEAESTVSEFAVKDRAGNRFPGWFVKLLSEMTTGKCIAEFDDGSTAAVSNAYGKGSAVRILTLLFQRYLVEPTDGALMFFKTIMPGDIFVQPIVLENTSSKLRLRRLAHPEGELIIIINSGALSPTGGAASAMIKIREQGTLTELNEDGKGRVYETATDDLLEIDIKAGDVAVFLWKQVRVK